VEGEHKVSVRLEDFGLVVRVHGVHPLKLAHPGRIDDLERAVGVEAALREWVAFKRLVVRGPNIVA